VSGVSSSDVAVSTTVVDVATVEVVAVVVAGVDDTVVGTSVGAGVGVT
jgi:hypothetical protein